MGSGEVAGSVLPSYEVGGDWFDYVENRDGAWIAIADATGKGAVAGALGGDEAQLAAHPGSQPRRIPH